MPTTNSARVKDHSAKLQTIRMRAARQEYEQAYRTERVRQKGMLHDVIITAAELDASCKADMAEANGIFDAENAELRAHWGEKKRNAESAFLKQMANAAMRRDAAVARIRKECEDTMPKFARPSVRLLDMQRKAEAMGSTMDFPRAVRARDAAHRQEELELRRTCEDHVAAYAVKEARAVEQIVREMAAMEERYSRVSSELALRERDALLALETRRAASLRSRESGRGRAKAQLATFARNARVAGKISLRDA